jgi:AAA ATPase domain
MPYRLALSEPGRQIIETARTRLRWNAKDERWLRAAHQLCHNEPKEGWEEYWRFDLNPSPSASTLRWFRSRKNIDEKYFVALCQAVGVAPESVVDRQNRSVIGDFPTLIADAPFYGRKTESTQLQNYVSDRNCRIVLLHGRAGMGKTTLASRVLRQVDREFEFLIWFSLESAPLLSELFSQLFPYFAPDDSLPHELLSFLKYLKQFRCLVVFDQWETINPTCQPGQYRPGYEDYGDLLDQVRQNHQSCVMIVSRVSPENSQLLKAGQAVQTLKLERLKYPDDREFLQDVSGTETELKSFIQIYNNPLILNLSLRLVKELRGGNIAPFVKKGNSVFGTDDVEHIMAGEFKYLYPLEKRLLYWLAIWQEPVSYTDIERSVDVGFVDFLSTLESLTLRRSLVNVCTIDEAGEERAFELDRLTLRYVTRKLVRQAVKELFDSIHQGIQPNDLILSHAFVISTDPELNRQQQRRIVRPIVEKLREKFPQAQELRQALEQLRLSAPTGYAQENLLQLLAIV